MLASAAVKSILLPSVFINTAGQNLSVTLPKPPTITLHISGWGGVGGSNEFVSYVSVCVSVRGLINVESNAARDTHTP